MISNKPDILCSTIIPTVGRSTLTGAVESVLTQSLLASDFEVIVINDSGIPLPEADANDLWRGNVLLRQSVLQAFADVEVDSVVTEYVPEDVIMDGWHRVDETNFYIFMLDSDH